MRYGSVPVVRSTGGLVDTVADGVTGFRFGEFSAQAFRGALERALETYRHSPGKWKRIQRAGMTADTSWARSAESYDTLYRRTLERGTAGRTASSAEGATRTDP
jgi:starch synthase